MQKWGILFFAFTFGCSTATRSEGVLTPGLGGDLGAGGGGGGGAGGAGGGGGGGGADCSGKVGCYDCQAVGVTWGGPGSGTFNVGTAGACSPSLRAGLVAVACYQPLEGANC